MKNEGLRVLALLSTALLCACISSGLYETARCAPPGRFEQTIAVEKGAVERDSSGWDASWTTIPATPLYALHFGLFRNCEVGLNAGLPAVGLSAKYTLVDANPALGIVADVSSSVLPALYGWASTACAGRVVVSDEHGPLGYVASLGTAYSYLHSYGDFDGSDEWCWSIVLGVGLPLRPDGYVCAIPARIGKRLRLMPVLSASVPVWTRRMTWSFMQGGGLVESRDRLRMALSFGVSLSYMAESTNRR